jgi:3-oxoacyl-[acyl-carrier protein] reductase
MKLKDRIVLITGAGSGLGRAAAVMMAKEGAKIGVNDIDEKGIAETFAALQGTGAEGLALLADVTKVNQVKEMFEKIVSNWGTIDILVNNAGIAMPSAWGEMVSLVNNASLKGITELMTTGKAQESMKVTSAFEDDWWHRMIDVHVNGTFYCTREALKIMEQKRSGKIINIASILGIKGGPGAPAYSAAKGAIIAFTRSVAQEVIGSNIMVNAVAPGWVDTPLLDTMSAESKAFLCAQTPLGRMGTPEEIANAIVFLATDDANFFVGQVISPNGGIVIG